MKVKYRSGYYKLSFKDKIKYDKKKFYLFYKRIKRFIERMIKENIQSLWILLILAIFISIFISIGINIDKYKDIFDGVWDFRDTILTTLIITFFINTITTEKQRHNNLIKQYDIYYLLEMHAEGIINELLGILGYVCNFSIFIDEENSKYFINQVKNIDEYEWNIPNNIDIKDYVIHIIQKFANNISYETSKINRKDVIGIEEYDLKYIMDSLNEDSFKIKYMEEENIDNEFIKNYIIDIVNLTYHLIATYRRPWRWDIKVDREIRKLLKNSGTFYDGIYDALNYYNFPKLEKLKTEKNNKMLEIY